MGDEPGGTRLSRPLARRALYPRRPRRGTLWGGTAKGTERSPVRTPRAEGGAGTSRANLENNLRASTRSV